MTLLQFLELKVSLEEKHLDRTRKFYKITFEKNGPKLCLYTDGKKLHNKWVELR